MLIFKKDFDPKKNQECAELYCEIWKEPPWDENFWQPEDVLKEMDYQFAKNNSQALMFLKENRVIGFSWGYEISRSDLREISSGEKLDHLFNGKNIFYIDELGVENTSRNQGFGEELTRALLELAIKNGFRTVTLRTDLRAIPARRVYSKVGFRELQVFDAKYMTRSYWILNL